MRKAGMIECFLCLAIGLFNNQAIGQAGYKTFYYGNTFVVPPSVSVLTIEVCARGGRGGLYGGGGGGGGGFAKGVYSVTPGMQLLINITTDTVSVKPFLYATSGENGQQGNSTAQGKGGAGGKGSGGNIINSNGGSGGNGYPGFFGGGGGGAGGPNGNGSNGQNAPVFAGNYAVTVAGGGAGGGGMAGNGGDGAGYITNSNQYSQKAGSGLYNGGGGGGANYYSSSVGYAGKAYCHISWGACYSPPRPWPLHTAACAGSAATLSAIGYDTLLWYSDTTQSPVATGNFATSPLITTDQDFYVRSTGCNYSPFAKVTAYAITHPTLSVVVQPDTLCDGETCYLSATGAMNYNWGHDQQIHPQWPAATLTNTFLPLNDSIIYLNITGSKGTDGICSDTTTVQIFLKARPGFTVSASSSTYCAGKSVTLSTTMDGIGLLAWSNGSGSSSTVVYPKGDMTYYLVAEGDNGCVYQDSVLITNNSPTVSVISTNSVVCRGVQTNLTALGASGYTWSTGQTGSSIAVTPEQTTTYTVRGIIEGCTAEASFELKVDACSALLSVLPEEELSIFPNPAREKVFVQSFDPAWILDSSGRVMFELDAAQRSGTTAIILVPGIYFLKTSGTAPRKFIIIP